MRFKRGGITSRCAEDRVTAFAVLVAVLAALVMSVSCRAAFADWTDTNGKVYPDSLAGTTVTFNAWLDGPMPQAYNGKWYSAHTTASGVSSGNAASYVYFEYDASPADTWYIYFSNAQSTSSAGTNGQRYAYSKLAGAWWGLASGVSSPTVTFYSGFSSDTIFSNHDFIAWVVDNSDYRTRYEGDQWSNPTISTTSSSFGWSLPETNVSSILRVYSRAGESEIWKTVSTENPCPRVGSYAFPASNYYKAVWSYSLAGTSYTYEYDFGYIGLASSNDSSIYSTFEYSAGSHQVAVRFSLSGLKPPTVLLQRLDSSGNWLTVGQTSTIVTDNSSSTAGYWAYFSDVTESGQYRVMVSPSGYTADLGYIDTSSSISSPDFSGFDVVHYISVLVQGVQQFVSGIPDLFAWLPGDIRALLFSALAIMIVLGLIGWLKG